MDFFFTDPELKRTPPAETRLLDLRAEPYPDAHRIRIGLELTPFEKRPTIELVLTDAFGAPSGGASVVEPVGWKLELTLHIRKLTNTTGTYTLAAVLAYPDLGEVDRREITVEVPPPAKK